MKNYLKGFDPKLMKVVRAVGREADKQGRGAYLVGGTVRDILLKGKNIDLDFTIEGDAVKLARSLSRRAASRLIVHKQFNTASLTWGGVRVDLAMARNESYLHPGALPTVRRGTIEEDLFRRDFTVNAMAICINKVRFGELVDLYGGEVDLKRKVIRILHERSFVDDPTRIIRAIRFEQRLRFKMDRGTLQRIKLAIKRNAHARVKPPRYFSEFKKLLEEQDPVPALKRMRALGALKFLGVKGGVPQARIKKLLSRIRREGDRDDQWLMVFMALIRHASPAKTDQLIDKLQLSGREGKIIKQARQSDHILKKLKNKSAVPSKVFVLLSPLRRETVYYLYFISTDAVVRRRIKRFLDRDSHVKLGISGNDLRRVGVPSGRRIGEVLEHILHLKLDGKIRTIREELKKALESLGK